MHVATIPNLHAGKIFYTISINWYINALFFYYYYFVNWKLNISTKNATTIQISNLEATKLQHIALVQKTIDYIQNNEAEKIVISRMEMLKHTNFEVLNSYKKMLKNYENAMVYLWFHPNIGCWMGASPERLLNCNRHKFKTMALAGLSRLCRFAIVLCWTRCIHGCGRPFVHGFWKIASLANRQHPRPRDLASTMAIWRTNCKDT